MGWWSESIMGGDTPLDFKGEFEDRFGSLDEAFNEYRAEDGQPPIPYRLPESPEVIEFLKIGEKWGDQHILQQVTGFLLMERGAPMSEELRALVIQGIDEENPTEDGWSNGEAREKVLHEFKAAVLAYPAAGAKVELPHQPGLFEVIGIRFS